MADKDEDRMVLLEAASSEEDSSFANKKVKMEHPFDFFTRGMLYLKIHLTRMQQPQMKEIYHCSKNYPEPDFGTTFSINHSFHQLIFKVKIYS